ncbi:hypothetical protein POTOM_027968 [Populus tomentosa]|uniref:glucose-6-phosphate 1-epimerase n=1 Tax=Populus tomentosa TaxID=118781 RepID=A0A8X8CU82_POPTO|nr:hypothetical protein POTOM_027968 [Populus tomentosa]
MAMASMSFSLPNLNPRRVNRYSGMAFASVNKETSTTVGVRVTEGEGNLPKVVLTSPHGSEAEIYLFGGCITSWKVPSGKDLLFVRPDAVFNKKKPISGGVPHCFPQFGPGAIQQHGFARNLDWSVVDSDNADGNPVVTLLLKDGPYSRSMWDFGFQALYKVILNSKSISTELIITNTDNKPFSFTSALHTYFSELLIRGNDLENSLNLEEWSRHSMIVLLVLSVVERRLLASVTGASVKGLKGCKTLDKELDPANPVEGKEERDVVIFPGFVDRVYLDAPSELQLDNGLGDVITIKNTNWSDAVLWNPHLQMEACYKDFVCVENAQIGNVQLEPQQSWTAKQHLSVD